MSEKNKNGADYHKKSGVDRHRSINSVRDSSTGRYESTRQGYQPTDRLNTNNPPVKPPTKEK